MLEQFKRVSHKTRVLLHQRMHVSFHSGGQREEGRDEGGLTAEAFTLFFRQGLRPGALFEGGADARAVLPHQWQTRDPGSAS